MATHQIRLKNGDLYEVEAESQQAALDLLKGTQIDDGGFRDHPMVTYMPEKKEDDGWSVGDIFKGAVETAGTMISGMTTGLVGQVTGAVDGYVGGLMAGMTPGTDEFNDNVRARSDEVAAQGTYVPRSEAGTAMVDAVGGAMAPLEVIEPLMPALGLPAEAAATAGAAARGVRAAGDIVDPNAGHSTKYVEDSLATNRGEGDPDYMTDPSYQPNGAMYPGQTADPAGQALQVTGGRFMAPEHVSMIQNADPVQRDKMARMRAESIASKNGTKAEHSPYNVIADEFENRSRVLGQVGERYLEDMAEARKATNQMDQNNVRTLTGELQSDMTQLLADNRITYDPNTGRVEFGDSAVFNGQPKLKKAIERFMRGTTTESGVTGGRMNYASFDDLVTLKEALQQAGYSAARKQGGNDKSTAMIQRLSGMVNGTVRSISPEYAAANDGLSMVINSMNDLARATKTDVNLNQYNFNDGEWRKVANNTRKLTSNYDAGVDLDQTLKNIDEVLIGEASKGGASRISQEQLNALDIRMDDNGQLVMGTNVRELAIFAHYMNLLNGDGKMTSFSGLTKEANNHLENLVANSVWGNQVGASAAGYKWLSNLKSDESIISGQTAKTRKDVQLDRKRREIIDDALVEMLGR